MSDDPTPRVRMGIQNDERGLTITKSLAWTIICALVGGGIWIGTQVSTVKTQTGSMQDVIRDAAAARLALEVRVRTLEMSTTASETRVQAMQDSINEIKLSQREILDLLRGRYHPSVP